MDRTARQVGGLEDVSATIASSEPFPHLKVPSLLNPDLAARALEWLRTDAPWRLKVESFYEQHEFNLLATNGPDVAQELTAGVFVNDLRGMLSHNFQLANDLIPASISAHRLTAGQTIRIHNDWLGGDGESHRFLVQLNDGWSIEQGGLLMLFGSRSQRDLRTVILPINASGFAFEISERSFHAVSTVRSGERFTLVYNFRRPT
jgi:Rps23 Pro-64 3,4-dihydroxylase Tpa1-like proline 4-hydroxylase